MLVSIVKHMVICWGMYFQCWNQIGVPGGIYWYGFIAITGLMVLIESEMFHTYDFLKTIGN